VQRQPDLSHTDTKTYPKLLAQRLGIEDVRPISHMPSVLATFALINSLRVA